MTGAITWKEVVRVRCAEEASIVGGINSWICILG